MKKNELNKNVILNEDAVKNIHCDEITAVINSNDSPKAMMNKLDDYHGRYIRSQRIKRHRKAKPVGCVHIYT